VISIENCQVGKFIRVDFHDMRKDGGLNATQKRCDWPLATGDKIIARDPINGGSCMGTVRAIGEDYSSVCGCGDVVIDLDLDTWRD
jgi:hypothetical protein